MGNLFKTFLKGILYIIGLPFFLLALLLSASIGLILFIVKIIIGFIRLISGKHFFKEIPEDIEYKNKLEDHLENFDTPVYQTNIQKTANNFVKPQPINQGQQAIPVSQEVVATPIIETQETYTKNIENEVFNNVQQNNSEYDEVSTDDEILSQYIPKKTTTQNDYDDSYNDNGIDIDYK